MQSPFRIPDTELSQRIDPEAVAQAELQDRLLALEHAQARLALRRMAALGAHRHTAAGLVVLFAVLAVMMAMLKGYEVPSPDEGEQAPGGAFAR